MGTIYYKYDKSFADTLIPQLVSQYNSDQRGSACWVYNGKIPFSVSLPGLKSAVNTEMRMYIDYLDNQTGYLRVESDDDNTLTDETILEYTNTNTWKYAIYTIQARLNNIIDPGDIQIFSCSTEGTTADTNITIRKVGLLLKDTGAIATWQADGVEPVTRESFFGVTAGGDPTRIVAIKSPVDAEMMHNGMACYGTTDPMYFKVGHDLDTYWRSVSGIESSFDITYFDNGTDDLTLSYYTDTAEHVDTLVTKTDSDTWLSTQVTISSIAAGVDGDLAIYSNTSSASDPIIDRGNNSITLAINGTPEPAHDPTNPQLGLSSIEFDGGNDIYIDPADASIMDFGTGAFTVMLWFKTTGTYHQNLITNNPDGTYNGFMLHLYHNDFYVYSVDGNRWEITNGTHGIDFKDTNWHHIALSSDGAGNLHVWFDGTSHYTRTYTSIAYSGTHGIYVGGDAWRFTGHFQDVYISKGTALFTDSFSLPITLMVDNPSYAVGGETPVRYNGEYTTYDADIKLDTSVSSQLYISSIDITSDNNAKAAWRP